MKSARFSLLFLSGFVAGLSGLLLWHPPETGAPAGTVGGIKSGPSNARSRDSASGPPAARRVPAPAMEEVFAATGLERTLVMARFLRTAFPAELAAVIDRSVEERTFDPDLTSLTSLTVSLGDGG
ncbi:MAG: hypothetical protein V4726_18690 [Verrucomicrobiota bacterium]